MGTKGSSQTEAAIGDDSETGFEIVEVSGTIKWFDASKGYGFVDSDDQLPDVLLHVNCLRSCGFTAAPEGARVVCDAVSTMKGLRAVRVREMDCTTAVNPATLPQRTHVVAATESDWVLATVKWFNRVRGFGFLTQGPGTPDVFVHMETIRRFGFVELVAGQSVSVRYGKGPNGLLATELKPQDAPSATSH